MDIVHPQIEEFIRNLGDHGDAVLAEMEQEAERRRFPIVGSQVGRLLYILTRSAGYHRVFEMGSGYGY
ncbi:MAG: O-methyltransferase, partial [Deinococcus sp.]|nr:O-methyltransferase [Deinococcus sp.]